MIKNKLYLVLASVQKMKKKKQNKTKKTKSQQQQRTIQFHKGSYLWGDETHTEPPLPN